MRALAAMVVVVLVAIPMSTMAGASVLKVGSTGRVSGRGTSYSVTLLSFSSGAANLTFDDYPGQSATAILQPGLKFEFLCMKVTNTGSTDEPNDVIADTTGRGTDGRRYPRNWDGSITAPGCPGMGKSGYRLKPGQTARGGFALQIPTDVDLTSVSWTPPPFRPGKTITWRISDRSRR